MADVAGWINADGIHEMARIVGLEGVQAAVRAYEMAGDEAVADMLRDYASRLENDLDLGISTAAFEYGKGAERVPTAWLLEHPEELVLDWRPRMKGLTHQANAALPEADRRRLRRFIERVLERLLDAAEPLQAQPVVFELCGQLARVQVGSVVFEVAPGGGWSPIEVETYGSDPGIHRVRCVIRRDGEVVGIPVGALGATLADAIRHTPARAAVIAAIQILVSGWIGGARPDALLNLDDSDRSREKPTGLWSKEDYLSGRAGWRMACGRFVYRDRALDSLDWFSPLLLWIGTPATG